MNDEQLKKIMTTLDKQDLREGFEDAIKAYPHERIGAYMITIMPPKGDTIAVAKIEGDVEMLAVAITGLLMSNATLRQQVVRALFQNLPGKGGQK